MSRNARSQPPTQSATPHSADAGHIRQTRRDKSTMQMNTIITGDCREILPTLPDKSFQLAFADPPYWVGFDYGEKTDKEMEYINPDFLVSELLRVSDCVLVTPGNGNQHLYPNSVWQVAWNKPAAMGYSKIGGWAVWEPILVYGKPVKRVGNDAVTVPLKAQADADYHTCPKPLKLMNWIVEKFTNPGDKILDPVCGSGTTLKAAKQLSREYLGIEIDPKIVKLSLERLANTQPPLLTVSQLTTRAPDLFSCPQCEGELQNGYCQKCKAAFENTSR